MGCNLSAIGHCPILYQITVSVQFIVLILHDVFPSYIGMYTDTASYISLNTSHWNYYASEIKYDVFPERYFVKTKQASARDISEVCLKVGIFIKTIIQQNHIF